MRKLLSDKGAAAVELAVTLPVAALIFVGAVDYGAAVTMRTKLNNATRAGAQYATFHPTDTCGIVAAVTGATNDSSMAITLSNNTNTVTSANCSSATTPNYCTCADSGATTVDCSTGTCASPAVKSFYVSISVTQTYTPTLSIGRLPFTNGFSSSAISMTGSAAIQFE